MALSPADKNALADELSKPVERKPIDSAAIAESILSRNNSESASDYFINDFDAENFASPYLRLSLSRGDNLAEKRARLSKEFPNGELRVMPESVVLGFDEDTIVWRESPQAKWKMVEPQGFQWRDLPMDIAESIAPSAEAIAAETAMAFGTQGLSVPSTVGRLAVGAATGEAFEQAGQYASGTQRQSVGQVAGEIGGEGALSAAGGFATSPLNAAYNALRGAGALRVGEEGIDVIRAANELDRKGIGEKLTPGLVTDNPIMQLQEKQSAALLPGFRRRYKEVLRNLDSAVRASAPGNSAEAMMQTVAAMKSFSDYFVNRIGKGVISLQDGGKALQAGIESFSKGTKAFVDELYDVARGVEEPQFALDDFFIVAGDIRGGAKGTFDPSLNSVIKEVESISGPKTLPSGRVLSVTDQIRNARTQLWNLKHVNPGERPTQATGQASDLYKALSEVLDNPVNANPNFISAWGAASEAARLRRSALDQAAVVVAQKSEEPYNLASSLVHAGQVDNILALRKVVPDGYWSKFVDSAYSEILRDPSKALSRLDALDQQTLDALIPRNEQVMLRKVVTELDRISKVGVDTLKERQVTNINFIDSLARNAEPRDALMLMRAANNTNNKAMRDSLRAAIVDWAWDGVIEKTATGVKANARALKSRIDDLKRSGLWRMLSSEEKKTIRNAEVVTRAFQMVEDAGTSIQANEAVKGLGRLQAGAIHSVLQAGFISQLYLSSAGRRIMIGGGLQNSNAAFLRAFGGALTQASQTEDISQLLREDAEQ